MTLSPLNRREFIGRAVTLGATALAGWPQASGAAEATPPRWQIGCYTRPWDAFELPVALDAIAEAGYRYAGLMTAKSKSWVIVTPTLPMEEAQRIGAEVKKRGLTTLSVYADFSVAQSFAQGLEELRAIIDRCRACGSPQLLLGGVADEKLYADYYRAIAETCVYAAQVGVLLTIKPHGGQNATGPQCRKAIAQVGHPNFRLWYDPGNIFYYSKGALDPVNDSATVDGLVAGMSVKDFLPPQEVSVTPGTGKVDFARVLANLRKGGFTGGPLIVECLKKGSVAEIVAEAKRARKFLEELIAG